MSDEKTSFILDLDTKDFIKSGLEAKEVINSIGSAEGFAPLLESLTAAAPLLATLGITALAFKQAINLTVEGEELKRVNDQFEILATKAGIGPAELKDGLEAAAKGLIDTNDLLKISNESLVKMSGGAEKLPDILTLAMKATQVFGGNAKDNFEAISNAISNGNVRMLKHYGIVVDLTKAEKDFADSNGLTADQLSAAGKQQALLNAVLEKGGSAFKNIEINTQSAISILQSLKTTTKEIGDIFTLVFEKTIGPTVRSFLGSVQNMATQFKTSMTASFGEGSEQAAAKLSILKGKISETEIQLRNLVAVNSMVKGSDPFVSADNVKKIEAVKEKLAEYNKELNAVQIKNKAIALEDGQHTASKLAGIEKESKAELANSDKVKKAHAAFIQELNKVDAAYYAEQNKNVTSLAQIDGLVKKKLLNDKRQHEAAILAIENNASMNRSQKSILEVSENKRFQEQMANDEKAALNLRIKLLNNYASHEKDTFKGIAAVFHANTLQMEQDQNDMQVQGTLLWNSISSNATSAFTTMGQQMAQGKNIAAATADAMKGFFLGFLGDKAIAAGSVMLLESIWPPNPVGLAGGAALLALGGALKSAAGSSAAPSTSIGSPSVQATASGSAPPLSQQPPKPVTTAAIEAPSVTASTSQDNMSSQQQQVQRHVTVNIAGNYLETDQTRQMLMNLMRQESDATGFSYNQIGA